MMLLKVLIWRNFESVAHDLLAIFVERECPGPSEGPSEAAGRSMLKKSAAALFVISGVSVGAAPAYTPFPMLPSNNMPSSSMASLYGRLPGGKDRFGCDGQGQIAVLYPAFGAGLCARWP